MTYEDFRRQYSFDEMNGENLGKDGGLNLGVFKAKDTTIADTDNNTVIVKVSQPEDGIFVNNEAKLILDTKVDSPYIANYLSWAENAGKIYIAMGFYKEKSLREKIESNAFTDSATKERFLRKVLEGIKALHTHIPHIVHKDLKPGNILIEKNNDIFIPRIADFGISAFAQKKAGSIYIVKNDACDARYASPEQKNGIEDVPMNADLYSFGVIALEVFTGKRPCDLHGDNELQNVIAEVPSENWRQLIESCLKNHLDRVQNAAACFHLLDNDNAIEDKGIVFGGNDTGEENDSGSDKQHKIRQRIKLLLILLMFLPITGGLLYYLYANNKYPFDKRNPIELVGLTSPENETVGIEDKTKNEEVASSTKITIPQEDNVKTSETTEDVITNSSINTPTASSNTASDKEIKSTPIETSTPNIRVPSEKTYSFGKYFGELKNDIPDGSGTMHYNSKVQIAKHGMANQYAEEGDILEGLWANGDIETGTLYNKSQERKATIRPGRRPNPYNLENDKIID